MIAHGEYRANSIIEPAIFRLHRVACGGNGSRRERGKRKAIGDLAFVGGRMGGPH